MSPLRNIDCIHGVESFGPFGSIMVGVIYGIVKFQTEGTKPKIQCFEKSMVQREFILAS